MLLALVAACLTAAPAVAQTELTDGSLDGGEAVDVLASFEWNTDGDFEGWTANANMDNAMVSGGVMSGNTRGDGDAYDPSNPGDVNSVDPFFSGPGGFTIGDGPGEVNRIQFALQMGQGSPRTDTRVFLFPASGTFAQLVFKPVDFPSMTDGAEHVYTYDFDSSNPFWGVTFASSRLDPLGDAPDVLETFAYDYVRVGSQAVPEPTSVGLFAIGALCLGAGSRRKKCG